MISFRGSGSSIMIVTAASSVGLNIASSDNRKMLKTSPTARHSLTPRGVGQGTCPIVVRAKLAGEPGMPPSV